MGLFEKIKSQAQDASVQPPNSSVSGSSSGSNRVVPVTFTSMPETLAEFTALPQAAMQTPFDTAALFIAALCVYPLSKDESVAMISHLKGPTPMTPHDKSFLKDRMSQNNKAPFLGASYFDGATPKNEYSPTEPYTVTVSENPYSYSNEGYAKLFIKSGGADSARPITMRQAKDGKWYLWEYSSLLVDILSPESSNPWATREFI